MLSDCLPHQVDHVLDCLPHQMDHVLDCLPHHVDHVLDCLPHQVDLPDQPLPDRHTPIIFDPSDLLEIEEEVEEEVEGMSVGIDAGGAQRGGMGGMGGMGAQGAQGAQGGVRTRSSPPPGMMTLSEAIAAGINVPAEMHAWSHIPEHQRYIDPSHVGPGMEGSPKTGRFKLPGAYKKKGCDLWRMDRSQVRDWTSDCS